MRIAIISDVHNNTTNLKKVLDYCIRGKIETIICCGDLASEETLEFLSANFSGTVHYAFGNMDNDQLREKREADYYKNIKLYKKLGEMEVNGRKIAFVHYPNIAKELCQSGNYQFVFYGHTHKPWSSFTKASDGQGRNCMMLNPGNVAGEIYPPTFAVWDLESGRFELIRIHGIGK